MNSVEITPTTSPSTTSDGSDEISGSDSSSGIGTGNDGLVPKTLLEISVATTAAIETGSSAAADTAGRKSSMVNSTPPSGESKDPATPPAAAAASSTVRTRPGKRSQPPIALPTDAVIWMIGPSRPIEAPVPMEMEALRLLISARTGWIFASR